MRDDKEELAWRAVKKTCWWLSFLIFISPVLVVLLVYWLIRVIAEIA